MWPIHGTGIAHANPLEDTATRGISRADFQTALKRTDTGWKSTRLHAHIPNLTVLYSPGWLAWKLLTASLTYNSSYPLPSSSVLHRNRPSSPSVVVVVNVPASTK